MMQTYLHSTMFLLIPEPSQDVSSRSLQFTFHNVSINTKTEKQQQILFHDLHSTMFLLIQISELWMIEDLTHLHSTMFLLIP